MAAKKLFTQIFIYFSKPLRLLYSLIIYEIVNFSFFTLYSLLLLSFFLYLKSVPIYVIVHVLVEDVSDFNLMGTTPQCTCTVRVKKTSHKRTVQRGARSRSSPVHAPFSSRSSPVQAPFAIIGSPVRVFVRFARSFHC